MGVRGVVAVSHKTTYMLSNAPVHVGIFSSAILHAQNIYVAANYRRSSAAANYFKSLATVLEKNSPLPSTDTRPGGWGGESTVVVSLCSRQIVPTVPTGSNKKQLLFEEKPHTTIYL